MSAPAELHGPPAELHGLFKPLQIGPATIRNRIAAGPSTLLFAQDNVLSERHVAYHAERALGGVGLIVTEEHAAHPLALGAFPDACTAWEPRAVPAMARLAGAVHEHGASAFVQLWATGVEDTGTIVGERWHPVLGASRAASPSHNAIAAEMSEEQIADLVAGHAQAARNVEVAGLDGVEIHAAHGWLVGQFLSPLYNWRSDRYGGTPERRAQLLIEIVEAIRARTGELALGVQLSVDEYVGEAGITPEATLAQVELLAGSGLVDYVNISTGSQYSRARTIAPMEAPEALLAEHGRAVKQVVGQRMKVLLADTIRTVEAAAALLEEGAADIVAMTRAHIADPFVVEKARAGRAMQTIPCVGENECILRTRRALPVACVMNPVSGRERRWGVRASAAEAAPEPMRVAVAGGGPAGLKLAASLAGRGHEVALWERAERVGGHLDLLARLPGRARWQIGVDSLAAAARRAGAELRVGEPASVESLRAFAPAIVLCATGATWDRTGITFAAPGRQPLPGIGAEHVLGAAEAGERALAQPGSLGERVLIVDETGEYLPLGLADLISSTAHVEVLTRHPQPFEAARSSLDGGEALARIAQRGAELLPGHLLLAVDGPSVRIREAWSGRERTIEGVDAVVLSMLRTPDDGLLAPLGEAGISARAVGDALAPRRTVEVVYEAEEVARGLGMTPGSATTPSFATTPSSVTTPGVGVPRDSSARGLIGA
ncbi:MAG: oxidoreductase [Solirubrobacteraceae bacterium]